MNVDDRRRWSVDDDDLRLYPETRTLPEPEPIPTPD